MINKIEQLEQLINDADGPVIVYVKHLGCEQISPFEHEIKNKLKEINRDPLFYVLCYGRGDEPFPEPYWNRVYFFEQKNQRPWMSWDARYLLKNFENLYYSFEGQLKGIPPSTNVLLNQSPEEVEEVRKMIETEDITKYPSAFQMSRNLFKEAWKSTKGVITTGQLLISAEKADERLGICSTCEFFNKKDIRCTQCGCFMEQKVHLKTASCPIKKW